MPDATLRDTLVTDAADETKTVETKTEETRAVTANPDASEIGQIFLDSGYTKDQLNDILESPKALAAIRHQLQTDPTEFIKMLERTDPSVGARLQEAASDRFLEQNKHLLDKDKGSGKASADPQNNDLMRELQALREKTDRLEGNERARENRIAFETAQKRYDSRVDELLSQKDIKELNLTKAETKAIRARLGAELSSDPNVVKRVGSGNFADVPRVMKGILEEWAGDRKEAVEADKTARERAQGRGFSEYEAGPDQFFKRPAGSEDSWEATEDALAKALDRTAR